MGNSSTKESRTSPGSRSRASSFRQPGSPVVPDAANPGIQPTTERPSILYSTRSRTGRHDTLSGLGGSEDSFPEPRKETRQEREARKAEKERILRTQEREQSLKEENVDGGFLVTLGTYTGPEDFSKTIVRQLMVERRLAPFWRGLNDHSESWTEHQLVAAGRGLPIPAPDEIPAEDLSTIDSTLSPPQPISFHLPVHGNMELSASQPVFSSPNTTSPSSAPIATSPLFRGRSKTLASFTSKNGQQTELIPQEIKLSHDPYVNGQPLEAYLYKDASECPICFLYYPPYLNRTRCCDQPICSECFVQIKRPDPHPPEHADPTSPSPPADAPTLVDEDQLVSEPAQCPFCVQPEFGITYDAPPFRRGLAYANHGHTTSFVKAASAMSSSASLSSNNANIVPPSGRRRGQSLSATAPQVVTTDRVRPDWAKKLSDARGHAARRSAAATALHNAAYLMGGATGPEGRFGIGRRRRNLIVGDSVGGSGNGSPGGLPGISIPNMEMLLAALEGQSSSSRQRQNSNDILPARFASRGSRMDDLEELMLMEAIRQSLVVEEERKQKVEKEAAKQTKKDEKQKVKDQKKADKTAKRTGFVSPGSTRNNAFYAANISSNVSDGAKGKAKATDFSGSAPQLTFATSPGMGDGGSSGGAEAQRHLERSRANLDSEVFNSVQSQTQPVSMPRSRLRHMSDASSTASSFLESTPGSLRNAGSDSSFNPSPNNSGQHLPFNAQNQDGAGSSLGTESMFNFQSLAAMIGKENIDGGASGTEYVEHRKESDAQAPEDIPMPGASSNKGYFPKRQMTYERDINPGVVGEDVTSKAHASGSIHSGRYEYHKQSEDSAMAKGQYNQATQ